MRVWISIFILLSLCQFGCTKKTSIKKPERLKVQLSKEPATFDWHRATDIASRKVILTMMATLADYEFNGSEPKLVPGLAEKWSGNKAFTRWKFHLKKDVKWSDGKAFTSKQVLASFKRLLDPNTAAFNAYYFYSIEGAENFNKGSLKNFKHVGVKILDDHTIEFILREPNSYFPKLLALFNTAPWRDDFLIEAGTLKVTPSLPVLGPYRFKEFKIGQHILLEKNNFYFGSPAKMPEIEFRILNEPSTALNLFKTGQLDILTDLPESEKAALKTEPEYIEVSELSIEYLGFNMKMKPFSELRFRKALSQATDQKTIIELLGGGRSLNPVFIPLGLMPGLKPNFAGEKPQKLTQKPQQVVLSFPSEPGQERLAEALQAQWKSALAWDVELEPQDWKVFLGRVNSQPPMLYRLGWMAIYPDPVLFLSVWTSDSHYNTSGWKNKAYDQLVARIRGEYREPQRTKLVSKALSLLEKDAVVIPLFQGARQLMVHQRLKDFSPNSLNRPSFHQVDYLKAEL